MTINDLNQLGKLRNEILLCEKRLEELAADNRQTEKVSMLIKTRKEKLTEKIIAAEEFINVLDDSAVRQIIELRFIRGWNWKKVASQIYGSPLEDRARKRVTRYFEKIDTRIQREYI